MKKLILPIIFIMLAGFFMNFASKPAYANPHCITFKVDVKVKDWPGGKLQVGCPGDGGRVCTGEIVTLRPGQKHVKLGKCSCYPNENGCVKVASKLKLDTNLHGKRKVIVVKPLPGKCKITRKTNSCGSNGQTKKATFKIVCKKPGVSITPGITITPTPGICVGPKPVVNVKVNCPTCNAEPTPTPIVVAEDEACGGTTNASCGADLECTNTDDTGLGICKPIEGGNQ